MSEQKRKELIREGKLNPDGSRPVELQPEGNGHAVAKPEAIAVSAKQPPPGDDGPSVVYTHYIDLNEAPGN